MRVIASLYFFEVIPWLLLTEQSRYCLCCSIGIKNGMNLILCKIKDHSFAANINDLCSVGTFR